MKTYTKTHRSKKVAAIHKLRIKKRGGRIVKTNERRGVTKITYDFPTKRRA